MRRGKAINRLLDFYLGIPLLNLFASVRARGLEPEQPERIGLLFNPALGDTLLASAAIQEIRDVFPTAKLILFATNTNSAAARLLPEVDAIELLPLANPLRSVKAMRRCRLDLMLDFSAWQRITALYTLLSGAQYTIGFKRSHQYRHRGYDKAVCHRGDCHELENLRRFTRSLGSRTQHPPRLLIPDGPVPKAIPVGRKTIAFHAWASGTRSCLREWPEDRWVALARKLSSPDRVFLLTGSPADEARCDALLGEFVGLGIPARVLIGRDGLEEIARALTRAEMLVSVNTGIMHLGAVLGVPTVAINGPTAVHRWGPVGPRVANVCPPDGSGGFLDLGFEYRGHTASVMNKISVADVLVAIDGLQGNPRSSDLAVRQPARREPLATRVAMAYERQDRVAHLQLGEKPAELL
jgi:heptosyltransferase I